MSTTRPLLGMITEVTCSESPGGRLSSAGHQPRDPLTEDEFAVPEDKQEELKCVRSRVEQVFRVTFTIIGLLDPTLAHGSKASRQIWLQLKGKQDDVSRAKEYVKGLCDPELQQVEQYPPDMHCIFVGAQGLFLDRLLRDTSAEVAVLELGRLRLLGRQEAVVMAQSRVQQFVCLFREKRGVPGDREPAVKRAFRAFVEERADKYTMELLLLPSALKEELLGLAQSPTPTARTPAPGVEARQPLPILPEQDRSQTSTPVTDLSHRILDATFEDKAVGLTSEAVLNPRTSHKRRSSESESRDSKRQYSLERKDEELETDWCCIIGDSRSRTPAPVASPAADKDVVVLDPSEPSDDVDGVSPETNFKCLVNFFKTMGYPQEVVERVVRETDQREDTFLLLERIVEESHRSQSGDPRASGHHSSSASSSSFCRSRDKERSQSRPFYELKSKENIQPANNCVGLRAPFTGSSVQQRATLRRSSSAQGEIIIIDSEGDDKPKPVGQQVVAKGDYLSRGNGHPMGTVRVETLTPLQSASERPSCSYQPPCRVLPSPTTRTELPPKAVPLTGVSRFQQSLRTPYRLTLQNESGRQGLRHVVIDGSNVAMAHGLHRFFSCRGIALAVETFWKMGHREITVFVPQWRQKKDPNITEQHFLSQLEDLRLLSFTPSREVGGQRISSHDDRFLLHLAEKTGGVIVTNDNMRDFVDTSEAWRKIVQERLLQFTFVEDHFMLPDDPLGKHGPRLEDFLRKDFSYTPVTVSAWPDLRATPPVYTKCSSRPSFSAQMRPASQWPHTGPPGWCPPRPSPSPPPPRSPAETTELKRKLYDIFPDQKQRIDRILVDNPYMRDLNALSGLLLG
uniref:NEDD4-binding protein 1 n=1 Tax=Paramormyrops kingsleyae TaxID=1676925 RepID=A0A3B3RE80_9TELE|nr:NEDD4-binding protein 1 [Paramormyrops kingsleyae]